MKRSRQLFDQMPDRAPDFVSRPSTSLRRSPRFLGRDHPPLSPDSTNPRRNPHKKARAGHQLVEEPEKSAKSDKGSYGPANLATGLRRSPRLSVGVEKTPECAKKGKANRRSPRLSIEVKEIRKDSPGSNRPVSSVTGSRQCPRLGVQANKSPKCAKKGDADRRSPRLSVEVKEMPEEITGRAQKGLEMGRRCCVLGLAAGVEERRGREAGHKIQVVKRKREEEASGNRQGWTKEQEAALERAYLAAKPTPNFWKKVAKLVPGKSAQECFDKVNSDLATPRPRSRSRTAKIGSSQSEPSPLSASKILKPVEPIHKVSRCNKSKSHVVQRTLRQLLRKHSETDQTTGADLFSILERNVDPSAKTSESSSIFSTPETAGKKQGFLHNLRGRSSSSKNPLSRFHNSAGEVLRSPPVLKPVKNRSLHEKYLDQLHCREAKRNLVSAGNKFLAVPKVDVVRAAKEALASDVRDAIHRLRDLRDSPNSGSRDLDDDYGADEDENGDVNGGI